MLQEWRCRLAVAVLVVGVSAQLLRYRAVSRILLSVGLIFVMLVMRRLISLVHFFVMRHVVFFVLFTWQIVRMPVAEASSALILVLGRRIVDIRIRLHASSPLSVLTRVSTSRSHARPLLACIVIILATITRSAELLVLKLVLLLLIVVGVLLLLELLERPAGRRGLVVLVEGLRLGVRVG